MARRISLSPKVSSYGSDFWTTTNAEFGSCREPSVLHQKRAGLISFELLRFLPNHPHWQDRPYQPGKYIKCPKVGLFTCFGSMFLSRRGMRKCCRPS